MLTRLIALCLLVAAFIAAPASLASADPYNTKLPTRTHIEVTVNGPDEPIILHVSASANYPTPPPGDIEVRVLAGTSTARGARAVGAAPLFTTTVHFTDDPVRIVGPRLPRGSYAATAEFTPDDSTLFLPSDDATNFRVGDEVSPVAAGPGDGLPDAGGPNLMWLLLGGGLVAAGAGALGLSRRRALA